MGRGSRKGLHGYHHRDRADRHRDGRRERHLVLHRPPRQAGRRSGPRLERRDASTRDRRRSYGGAGRDRLLPAHRRHRGEDVRRGQDPRRLLQARGQGVRARDPQRTHGRPADPAALAQGIPQRGADHRHGAVGRLRRRARRARDQRRLRRADAVAAALPGPGRSRPRRPHRGRADAQPDAARDGDLEPRPDRLRLAGRDHDGRGRRQADRRGRHPRGAGDGPRGDQAHLRRPGRAAGQGRQAEVVRRERQGRPRVALQLAARRGPGQERPGRHLRGRRRDGRRRAPRRRPPMPARTSWCAATTCAWPPASSPTSAAPRPSSRSSPSSSATPSARCPTPSRTPRSSSRRSARR